MLENQTKDTGGQSLKELSKGNQELLQNHLINIRILIFLKADTGIMKIQNFYSYIKYFYEV